MILFQSMELFWKQNSLYSKEIIMNFSQTNCNHKCKYCPI